MTSAKVAIIGCGRIAGHHGRAILETNGLHLVAVCDLVESKARKYGREFKIPYYTSYHHMLRAHPEVDIVAIMTPSGMHYEHTMDVLKGYNKDVIVEKPTFLKFSQMDEVSKVKDGIGRNIYPIFQNRYNRAVARVKQAIDSGELGQIRTVSVRVRWCRPQRYYDLSDWRGTYAMDGGALTNQGIHHVDLLRYLGGEVESVCASMETLGANIEVEDTVVAIIKYKNSIVGNLEITTAARPYDFEASLSFVGEKGVAQIGGIAVNELQIFTPDPSLCEKYSEDFSDCVYGYGHIEVYKDIVRSRNGVSTFPVSCSDARESLKLLHAFYESSHRNSWVHLDDESEYSKLGKQDPQLSGMYMTPTVDLRG